MKVKMKKFGIRKLLYNDRVLMIISVILGIVVWAFVVNVADPNRDQRIANVPINVDTASLEKLGLSVISLNEKVVNVNVKGERMVVSQLTPDDFIASVSLFGVDAPGTYDLEVQVSKKYQNTSYEIIQPTSPIIVSVRFDKYVSKKVELSVDLSGVSVPSGGEFIMGKHYIVPGEVTVSGPEADVARVATCVVAADFPETLDKITTRNGALVLRDVEDKPVDMSNLKLDRDNADVVVQVLKQKRLPLELEFINVPDNLSPDDLEYSMSESEILVAGPAETIDTRSKISVGYMDIKQIEPDSVFVFDIELPEGFVNIDNVTTVQVDFTAAGYETRKFNVKTINLVNVPSNYNVKLASKGISNVSIVGPADILDQLTAGDIVAEVDLADRNLGTGTQHNIPVRIVIPSRGKVWAVGDYSAVITAYEK